jgi:hypothetical protein
MTSNAAPLGLNSTERSVSSLAHKFAPLERYVIAEPKGSLSSPCWKRVDASEMTTDSRELRN